MFKTLFAIKRLSRYKGNKVVPYQGNVEILSSVCNGVISELSYANHSGLTMLVPRAINECLKSEFSRFWTTDELAKHTMSKYDSVIRVGTYKGVTYHRVENSKGECIPSPHYHKPRLAMLLEEHEGQEQFHLDDE